MNTNFKKLKTSPGMPLPLGATLYDDGVQFAIFSRNAESVSLILFDTDMPDSKFHEIPLPIEKNKTGDVWHIWVQGLIAGQVYGYRIDGPYDPKNGQRFNKNKLLLDPYAKSLTNNFKWDLLKSSGYDRKSKKKDLSFSEFDNFTFAPRCIVAEAGQAQGYNRPNTPLSDSIIYELHVKGFTAHKSSKIKSRGTYKGLTEKIPYLKDLGTTAVELLPIHEFDENENMNVNPDTGEKLKNYWGYSTISFFAPSGKYSSTADQIGEFKEMVDEFHKAGIEVIIDVVFNHTAETDELGPTISFRGIDNSIYYMLKNNKRFYKNFTGCGNTFNCNHPVVQDLIIDSLRHWAIDMNVDGFRFDLTSVLSRGQSGSILRIPQIIQRIEDDPVLRNLKIIAEPWDAGGAYQLGGFPGRWSEWNGKYRDEIKKFWRGDNKTIGYFATRVTGSSDLYHKFGRGPEKSINFITSHDGFTMNDLVCFNKKRNHENGENGNDGENNNYSFNLGIEGLDSPVEIDLLRIRQIKNFITTLFISRGVPMFLAGDEFRRTQKGNNNAYCQDNDISWIDWGFLKKNMELFRFTKEMIRFRKEHKILRINRFFSGSANHSSDLPDISWWGSESNEPDWSVGSHSIALLVNGEYYKNEHGFTDSDIFIIFNASEENISYNIPISPSGRAWKIAVDTSMASPQDISASGKEPKLQENSYGAKKMSTAVLIA